MILFVMIINFNNNITLINLLIRKITKFNEIITKNQMPTIT